MKAYTVEGNVIKIQEYEVVQKSAPALQVVDTDLMNRLYTEMETIATNRKGRMDQEIWFVKGELKRTTVWQYAKKEFKKIAKIENYIERLTALKRLYAIVQIFGVMIPRKDADGQRITALNQITQDMVDWEIQKMH